MFPDLRGDPGLRQPRLPARLARLTATVEPAAAVTSRSHRPRLVNREASVPQLVLVHLGKRAPCAVIVVHLDERESSRLACGAVTDYVDGGDASSTLKQGLKVGFV